MPNDTFEVRRHDFQEAKSNIKKFSEAKIDTPKFDSVATETFYGLMNRSVTGSELNERINKIQNHFIKINEQLNAIKGQFGNIYETFDSLDKDYIDGIVASIDTTKIVSNQALETAKEAKKNSSDIERSLQTHVNIIQKLEAAKNSSESKFAMIQNEINQVENTVNQRYEMLGKLISSQSNSLTEFRNKQVNRNDEFLSQIEKIKDEARENDKKSHNLYHEQNAIFSKKMQKAHISIGAFGLITTVNLLLTALRAI